jgi:hypothetical protein
MLMIGFIGRSGAMCESITFDLPPHFPLGVMASAFLTGHASPGFRPASWCTSGAEERDVLCRVGGEIVLDPELRFFLSTSKSVDRWTEETEQRAIRKHPVVRVTADRRRNS